MNKTDIITAINTNLADSSNITAQELRNVFFDITNEFYPVQGTQQINVIVNANQTNIGSLKFRKMGNIVFVSGSINNPFTFDISDLEVQSILIENLLPNANTVIVGSTSYEVTIKNCALSINTNGSIFLLDSTIPPNKTVYFNTNYFGND